jgi:hypothetical protein
MWMNESMRYVTPKIDEKFRDIDVLLKAKVKLLAENIEEVNTNTAMPVLLHIANLIMNFPPHNLMKNPSFVAYRTSHNEVKMSLQSHYEICDV